MKAVGPAVETTERAAPKAKDQQARPLAADDGFAVPAAVRARMESIIGGDLSGVRLHTGTGAARQAAEHRAFAVAEGQHIAFAAGAYRPGTIAGEAVLAHELAHTRQQSGSDRPAAGGAGTLERQADHAGYVAALSLLDPYAAARVVRPEVSAGHGLRLQRCSDISPQPSREEYERRKELLPRPQEDVTPSGMLVPGEPFSMAPPGSAAAGQQQAAAVSAQLASAHLFSTFELNVRLDILDRRQKQIDASVADLQGSRNVAVAPFGFTPWAAGDQNIAVARDRISPGGLALLAAPNSGGPPDPAQLPPESRAQLSEAIVAAEPLQRHSLDMLGELRTSRQDEVEAGRQLEGYDVTAALAAIDGVRRGYRTAADLVLTPSAASALAAADQQQAALQHALTSLRLDYFQRRTSDYGGVQSSLRMIHQWAAKLQGDLDGLEQQAAAVQAARESGALDLPVLESSFADQAQLIEVSIEALGEWDKAVRAYELLSGSWALWGYGDVDRIAARLAEMRAVAYAGDLPYLKLLLRDHRADPAVTGYYASLPSIIEWSHVIIGLAITLLAAVATAGVGLVVGVVAEAAAGGAGWIASALGFGVTTAARVVVSTEFLINLGGEAFVFNFISRQLSALVPGMAPTASFWGEFVWNLGLFGVLKGAGRAAKALVNAMAITRFAGKLAVTAGTQFAALEAFGYFRFAYDNKWRTMSLVEFGKMSAQNAIMMGVTAVVMGPLQPLVQRLQKTMPTSSLARLARGYRAQAAQIAARRAALETATEKRISDQPNPAPDEIPGLTKDFADEGQSLNDELQALVDSIYADPQIKIDALPTEVADLLGQAENTSVPDLMVDLEQAVELRPTGQENVWTFDAGQGPNLTGYLEEGQYQVTGDAKPLGGHEVIEAIVPGKGEVTFVERDPEPVTSPAEAAVPPALEAIGARSRNAQAGLDWARTQTVAPALVGRLAEAAQGTPGPVHALLELAGRVARARGGPDPAALAAGGEIAAEALSEARSGDQAVAAALETALQDPVAAVGLTRLSNLFGPSSPVALASILAAAPPDNIPQFLRAAAESDLGGLSAEFYQGLARSRPACDLAVRYGGKLLLRIVNLQPGRLPGERMAYSRVDVERVLQGLDVAAADPTMLAERQKKLMSVAGRKGATPQALDKLVGPRPRPVVTIEPKPDDPSWGPALKDADAYTRDHPPAGGPLSPAMRRLRASLFQVVARARSGEFGHLTPAERQALQDTFNDLARAAGMVKGWISSVRGSFNEALARGTAHPSVRTVWDKGKLVVRGSAPEGSTIPDEAWPPVTQGAIDDESVMETPRRWYEDKSYGLLGKVDAGGVRAGARATATTHLNDARGDLANLPRDSTIAIRYSVDPGWATKRAMADILYEEAGVEQVIFQGEVIPRRATP